MNNNTVETNNELDFEWPAKSVMADYITLMNIFNALTQTRLIAV